MTKNIMIVGVGGQGTLLASRILGNTVINEGYDVKVSEVHGMSQRGGSVVTYVKYGDKVYSPIIDEILFVPLTCARHAEQFRISKRAASSLQTDRASILCP